MVISQIHTSYRAQLQQGINIKQRNHKEAGDTQMLISEFHTWNTPEYHWVSTSAVCGLTLFQMAIIKYL